ncbi:rRNA methyltransferase 3A, mitochondrial-like [Micropterus salmoides]|uniref:rRNA methyltransferase 3A, mitochondrial n=1 Tax=Micropterus salmoides TaxID=27706 RepID=UPI0018EC835D|nr:rRNA methyltransferase 3A, mitochondrial [Micropterus salmoides]XP_038550711.1 rRNA methyltransferase 3A, mitochondrial-like [Micropterus salmoides]
MAAYMRSVICLVSIERNAFLTRGSSIVVQSKRYVRGLRRKPVRVLFPENETDKVHKPSAGQKINRETEAQFTSTTRHLEESDFVNTRSNVQSTLKHAHVTKDQIDGLRFERALPGDKRLARLVSVARSRTFREHQGKILLEGRRLICDALDAGANPQMVFFSTVDRLRELPLNKLKRATLVKVKFEDIKIWSDLVAPQGVIAIFSRPDPSRLNFANRGHSLPLSLICDNIRDPGNLGTMLRCAAAAGCNDVLLTKGCVDAWEPKVLRAAMGAHFRLPIYPSLGWDDIKNHLPKPVTVHVADSSCGTDRSRETEDSQVNMSHKSSKAGDYGWVSTKPNHNNMRYEEYDSDSGSDSEYEGLELPRVDTKLYHDSWARNATALVIGGETQGLSLEAAQLAEKTAGHRLFIPVVPDVDSLNSAMAASILLFEGRKQLLKLKQIPGR